MKRLALVGAVAALVALVAFAYLLGRSNDADEQASLSQRVAVAGPLELRVPGDWRLAKRRSQVPGLELSQPIRLQDPGLGRNAGLSAGTTDAIGPTLLPTELVTRLANPPPEKVAVKLGKLEAYRYRSLALKTARNDRFTVYAAPTTSGVATIVCRSDRASQKTFGDSCEAAASSLELVVGRSFRLGVNRAYQTKLRVAFRRLNRKLESDRRRLRSARTPAAQDRAARSLEFAYRGAADALSANKNPLLESTNDRLLSRLRQISQAYDRLAEAARDENPSAYAAARKAIADGEDALRKLAN